MTSKRLITTALRYGGLMTALMLLIAFFSLATESFFQIGTARLIANQIPQLTLIAIGMSLP